MPQVINTNVMSLNAQRQLNKSQLMQNEAMERLSSGLRINSAKDDAAGLGISTGMQSQIRGINQAVRNANDGISMAQTAEGAMDEMTNILQRMRELSVQAANDTNSASNRASIQAEIDQLYDELDRIAGVTQFNGINLLDGSNSSTNLQIGANNGESLGFTIDAVTTKDLNLNAVSGLGELNGGRIDSGTAITNGEITINNVALTGTAATTATGIQDMINAKTGSTGVIATAYNAVEGQVGVTGITSGGLTVNGATIAASGSAQELVDNINRDAADVTAKLESDGSISIANDTGKTITIGGTAADVSAAGLVADTYAGYISLSSVAGEEIEIGLVASAEAAGAVTTSDVAIMGFLTTSGSDSVEGFSVSGTNITEQDAIAVNGVEIGRIGTSSATAGDIAFAINAVSEQSDVTATAFTQIEYEVIISEFAQGANTAAVQSSLAINGIYLTTAAGASVQSIDDVVTLINNKAIPGVTASVNTETGRLILTSQGGADIKVNMTATTFNTAAGGAVAQSTTTRGTVTLEGNDGADVIVTSNAANESDRDAALLKLGFTDVGGSEVATKTGLSVTSVQNANNTITRLDEALEQISSSRGRLGAVQNRLSSTISNLENVSQNLSAANSRIRDADFAVETSKLSKAQILQQAGTSMLAQANASSQSVLSLLG